MDGLVAANLQPREKGARRPMPRRKCLVRYRENRAVETAFSDFDLNSRDDWEAVIKAAGGLKIHVKALSFSASHAARCVACQGVRSQPVPVALVGEYSIPVV